MTMMRQIRAVAGIAVTWGVAFSALAVGALLAGVAFHVLPQVFFGLQVLPSLAGRAFLAGAVGGTLFALVFARAERNRTVATLSVRRAALWGFVGAAALPTALVVAFGPPGILPLGVMGAASLGYG